MSVNRNSRSSTKSTVQGQHKTQGTSQTQSTQTTEAPKTRTRVKKQSTPQTQESQFKQSSGNTQQVETKPTGSNQKAPRGSLKKKPPLQRTKNETNLQSNPGVQQAKAKIQRQNDAKAESQNFASSQPGAGALQGEKYAMKSMGQEYIQAEKNAPSDKMGVANIGGSSRETRPTAAGTHATSYMTPKQKTASEVTVDGSGGGTKLTQQGKAMTGENIFVMDGQGKIMAQSPNPFEGNSDKGKVMAKDSKNRPIAPHHSNFLRGESVSGAGELHTDGQGNLKKITDQSGHYKPGAVQTQQVLKSLEDQGANLDNVKFKASKTNTEGMAKEFQQGGTVEQFKKRHDVVDEMKSAKTTGSKGAQMFLDAQNKANNSPDNSK